LNFILERFYLACGILRRMKKAGLQFHIQQNDYFGTVATVLDLLRQDLDRRGYNPHAGTLSRLRDDLVYLQRSHRIEKGETPRLAKSKMQGEPSLLTPAYCPLTVHYRRASGRHAGIKETGKNVEGVSPTPRKYWGL
jgi:hypothetical protein